MVEEMVKEGRGSGDLSVARLKPLEKNTKVVKSRPCLLGKRSETGGVT